MKRTNCWFGIKDGLPICGKHNRPLGQTGTLNPAPPYSREIDSEEDLLECPESGQFFHVPTEKAAQTTYTR
jgi:hypothetical protein